MQKSQSCNEYIWNTCNFDLGNIYIDLFWYYSFSSNAINYVKSDTEKYTGRVTITQDQDLVCVLGVFCHGDSGHII